jgi:hypothetical protein
MIELLIVITSILTLAFFIVVIACLKSISLNRKYEEIIYNYESKLRRQ